VPGDVRRIDRVVAPGEASVGRSEDPGGEERRDASFALQVVVVVLIMVMSRRLVDPPRPAPRPRFDVWGAVLSGAGLFFVVFGCWSGPIPACSASCPACSESVSESASC
jgi:hypothetical protein